ncbi:putative homeodomain-like, Myb-like domain protein [Heracleum sosnowskyi]|uniref:Homeodomain-like, Myb-like domain protein n=1 Tax=Heracleum sosnowskyi TaxID=360622 RepID=A0AAD8HJB5_9APIA|nr:putative homeodomain-like, Myb-like domain protein [Heracleum sosnowskyi]
MSTSTFLRTRSQAAPDWTHQEHLILVNEITAVERDCLNTFSSFQKWQIIVENCNALGLNRSLNQCKKMWNTLFDDFNNLKNFDAEVYKGIEEFVRVRDGRSESDPDSDPVVKDVKGDELLVSVFKRSVSPHPKKYNRKITPKKHFLEGWGARRKSSKIVRKPNKLCRSEVKVEVECPKESVDVKNEKKESDQEEKVQRMTIELLNSAEQINTVLEGKFVEEVDYVLTDLESAKTTQAVNVRRQGDELITCLENYTHTLDQLCLILKRS